MLKLATALFLLLASAPALAAGPAAVDQAISANIGDPAQFREAFDAIQASVADDDAEALSAWVAFPINVRIGNTAVTIEDADAFISDYAEVFSAPMKAAIVGQKYDDLFVNYSGAMFGNGQLWVAGVCKTDACDDVDMRIITIQEAAPK